MKNETTYSTWGKSVSAAPTLPNDIITTDNKKDTTTFFIVLAVWLCLDDPETARVDNTALCNPVSVSLIIVFPIS